jgi:triosephosphate isomerase
MRTPLIVANWKMHKTIAQATALIRELLNATLPEGVDIVVAPPFTALSTVASALHGCQIRLGAQTMHEATHGAFTGEISPVMLHEIGVRYVILGHSERRAYDNETDGSVARKVRSALVHGLTPIVAVGETRAEHDAGLTIPRVLEQTRIALADIEPWVRAHCVIAYEPIWAIGTGLIDEPESANTVIAQLRSSLDGLSEARILYGGSMNAHNAASFLAQPHIDGGLIGGAGLNAHSFLAIIEAAHLEVAR